MTPQSDTPETDQILRRDEVTTNTLEVVQMARLVVLCRELERARDDAYKTLTDLAMDHSALRLDYEALVEAVRDILDSAHPHPVENRSMFTAFKAVRELIEHPEQ